MSHRVYIFFLCLVFVIPEISAAGDGVKDLDNLPRAPRYSFNETPYWGVLNLHVDGDMVMVSDVDGDGYKELICAQPTGAICYDGEPNAPTRVSWQFGFPAAYRAAVHGPKARRNSIFFGPPDDITGDGTGEILYSVRGVDTYMWLLGAFDPLTEDVVFSTELPAPEEAIVDGRWDGHYRVAGVVPASTPDSSPMLIVCRTAGFDLYGRGILAIDTGSAEILWYFATAGNPDWKSIVVEDVDGDGEPEIVFVSNSPDNMKPGHESIDGLRDDTSTLFALKSDGCLLWRQRLGGAFFSARLRVSDLDGDGVVEVVTASHNHSVGFHDNLCVWSGPDGRLLAQKVSAYAFWGLAVRPGVEGGAADLYVGSDGGMVRYRYKRGRISLEARAVSAGRVQLVECLDILPDVGLELVVVRDKMPRGKEGSASPVMCYILNESFDILACSETAGVRSPTLCCWRTSDDDAFIIGSSPGARPMALQYDHRSRIWMFVITLAVLLIAVGAVLSYGRWHRRRVSKLALPDRLVLDRLNAELEVSNHGALAVTRGLRRLIWLLKATRTEESSSKKLRERGAETWADFLENGHKTLVNILCLAETANFRPDLVRTCQHRLSGIMDSVADLMSGDLGSVDVSDRIDAIDLQWKKIEEALRALSRAVANYYSSRARTTIERILLLWEDELDRAGVELDCDVSRLGADVWVRIYPGDLRFILDNLVGNAFEAMSGEPVKELSVRATEEGNRVTILVGDSGRGMTADKAVTVLTRRGGGRGRGLGLWRSRKILYDVGGELQIDRTAPGEGTVFSLRLISVAGVEQQEGRG